MFEGFDHARITVEDVTIDLVHGGTGPPLPLLHGYPQTHVMWHKVAPGLAEHFTVVATDLRGYGDSSAPPTTDDDLPYSKRVTADEQVAVMGHLGFERFHVAGHDRGGRVTHRRTLRRRRRVARIGRPRPRVALTLFTGDG